MPSEQASSSIETHFERLDCLIMAVAFIGWGKSETSRPGFVTTQTLSSEERSPAPMRRAASLSSFDDEQRYVVFRHSLPVRR